MTQAAKIKEIKRKGKNCLLVFQDGEEVLVTRPVLKKYSLAEDIEITGSLLAEIREESDLQRAEYYVTYLLSRRGYSSGLLRAKMREKGYEKKIINQIILKFMKKGLIDDTLFARQVTESILRNKPAGRNYIIGLLCKKYIPRPMAESVVDSFFQNIDETEIALRLLRSRWRYFSKFELESARRKAYNYLSRRSIGYRSAKMAFEKLVKEDGQD